MHGNSNPIQFFVYGTLTFLLLLCSFVFMLIIQQKRRRLYLAEKNLYLAEKKESEYKFRNELLNAQLEVQEQSLNELSREIHDNVGQVLSLVKVHLFTVANQLDGHKTVGLIQTSSELLEKALEDLRNISHTQSADMVMKIGLQEAIQKELYYISNLKKQACELQVAGEYVPLPPGQELLIYRIAQEAIHNSIKHARGSRLTVRFGCDAGFFSLSVSDDGAGFDAAAAARKGLGLSHMKHRAHVLNGALGIKSEPGQGATIILKMPIPL